MIFRAASIESLRPLLAKNLFLRWRAAKIGGSGFFEKPEQPPAEALLQQAWRYQRIVRERLQTTDGQTVRILHPGFWNQEPGPDFRKAVVQIGDSPPVTGDVEIDILPAGWRHHAHAGNPNYRNVVLHVTWEPATAANDLPTVCLKHALDSTVPELSFWLGLEPKAPPDGLAGQCSAPFRSLDPATAKNVLRQAAEARMLIKAEQLQAGARHSGWDAALWEGLFGALGYKRNVWPMRRIAEVMPRLCEGLTSGADHLLMLQARCFGVANFLPSELRTAKVQEPVRKLWDIWWREAEAFRDVVLPASVWSLGGIRPANHPQRRLALAAHWMMRPDLPQKLERWLARQIEAPDLITSLEEILQVKHDEFWSYRWTWNTAPFRSPQPLLGTQRLTDIAINVILPWLYLRASASGREELSERARSRYFQWPAGEDNAVLRLARQRLFGGVPSNFLSTAAEQQGVLQITRDFCDHSNAACHQCQFPELLRTTTPATTGSDEHLRS